MICGSALAMADLAGNGSGGGLPGDPYIFGYSDSNSVVLLTATNNYGHTYVFRTDYGEINFGTPNQGWWSTSETNSDDNGNYVVGTGIKKAGDTFNDYFTFRMNEFESVRGTIVSASLVIPTGFGNCTPQPSCEITEPYPVTYQVGSVSVGASALNNKSDNPDSSMVTALASGKVYGDYTFDNLGDYSGSVTIALDSAALADLNAVIGSRDYFSIGGTVVPATAPEPGSLVLLGSIVAGVFWSIQRKPRQ